MKEQEKPMAPQPARVPGYYLGRAARRAAARRVFGSYWREALEMQVNRTKWTDEQRWVADPFRQVPVRLWADRRTRPKGRIRP